MESPSRFAVDQVWKGSYMEDEEDDRVFAKSRVYRVSDRGQDRDRSEYMMNQGRRYDNPCLPYSMLTTCTTPFSPPPPASLTGSLPAVGRVVLQRCPLLSLSLLSCEWSSRVEGVHYVHHAGPQVGLHEEGLLYTISVSVCTRHQPVRQRGG